MEIIIDNRKNDFPLIDEHNGIYYSEMENGKLCQFSYSKNNMAFLLSLSSSIDSKIVRCVRTTSSWVEG